MYKFSVFFFQEAAVQYLILDLYFYKPHINLDLDLNFLAQNLGQITGFFFTFETEDIGPRVKLRIFNNLSRSNRGVNLFPSLWKSLCNYW